MKRPYLFLLLVSLLVAAGHGLRAQSPFAPHFKPEFPGMPGQPRKMIILENKKHPKCIVIKEGYFFQGTINKTTPFIVNQTVRKIKGDSLYFDTAGYSFRDVEVMKLPYAQWYNRADSGKWSVTFPPEHVYTDRFATSLYLKQKARETKEHKFNTRSARSYSHMIKWNFTKIANAEIAFDYEKRISDDLSVEVEAGYQFDLGDKDAEDFWMDLIPMWKYRGINIIAGPKYFFRNVPYLQFVAIYHYLEMDRSRTKFASGGDYALQSQYRHDVGGAIRFGFQTKIYDNAIIDSYVGIGLKVCFVSQYTYGHYPYSDSYEFVWENPDHSPDHGNVTQLYPVISLGVKFGVGF